MGDLALPAGFAVLGLAMLFRNLSLWRDRRLPYSQFANAMIFIAPPTVIFLFGSLAVLAASGVLLRARQ
jgi:hypothetical protein